MADSGGDRPAAMKRGALLVATAGLSLLNGTHFSPLFDPLFFLMRPFAPAVLSYAPMLLFYFTSVLLSLMTLLLAGVPASIYERIMGLKQSTPVSLGIWLIAAFLLTLPSLMAIAGRD
jgi:hypothetical protein